MFKNYFEKTAKRRTREILLGLSPRQLQDTGISADLLEQGIHTWPWREDYVAPSEIRTISRRERKKARRQLEEMSDKALADIGICRGDIARVVG